MPGIPNTKKGISLVGISSQSSIKQYPTGSSVIGPGTDGYVLQSDSTSPTGFSWVSSSGGGGGGSPTGNAGGDLTGSYPNPTIKDAAITPIKADLNQVWNFTNELQVDSMDVIVEGDSRLTNSRAPTGNAGGDLTGTYPNPTLAAITTAGTSGSANTIPVVTIDTKGRVTTLSSSAVSITTASVSGLGTAAGLTSDTDGTLAANSDTRIATQKATKTYADTKVAKAGDTMTGPLVINSNSTITGSLIVTGSITTQTQLDFDAVAEPTNAVTLTLAGVAGNVNVGSHYYYVSFVTALGETSFFFGTEPSITTTAGNQQVIISNIPVSPDPRVTARRIYRNGANQSRFNDQRILTTINDNTTTTYTDNIADASRTGAANYYFRENTTCRYITKDTAAAMFVGVNCTSFGQGALATLNAGTHTGGGNTCIGRNAGYLLSTGNQNIIISNNSTPVTTGDSNVLIHGNWGNNPAGCVIIGRNAGAQNSGTNNVAIGNAAGSSGHNNGISIGVNSNTNVTGQGNIAIGVNAGNYSATAAGAFNINIGSGARSLTSGSSGQINIGNVIYGVNAYQSTTADSTPTATGRMGIGLTTPTARLHLPAGTTAASMAPLKFTSGSLLATPESGSMEYDGDKLHLTITSSSARKEFTLNDTALTSGSIPVATTNGRLTNSNKFNVYATGTTNGTLNSSVSIKVLTFTTANEYRFLRLAVKAEYFAGATACARTINAAWSSGSMGLMQIGTDELGTLMSIGDLASAVIQTSGSGADIYVKCTDGDGTGGTTNWTVSGEYF